MSRLDEALYEGSAVDLAPLLLGKLLCRNIDGHITRMRITETECYYGEADTACHASKGKTNRTRILYQPGGIAYVYLCYGIHSLLNVVTGPAEFPQAVLIRGIEGFSGPGRLTRALGITTALNGEDLTASDRLWLEQDGATLPFVATPRIGIGYASLADQARLWRFVANDTNYPEMR